SRNTVVATVNTIGVNGARLIRAIDEGQTRVVATSGVFGDSVDVSVNLIYTSVQIATTGPTPTPLHTARINRLNRSLQLGLIVRQVLASINVTPASPAPLNFVGDTQTFAAEPRDSGGAVIPGQAITWSPNNPVLGINAAGLATAVQRSSATGITVKVRAATGGITDSSRSIVFRQVPRFADLNPGSFPYMTAIGRTMQVYCVLGDS